MIRAPYHGCTYWMTAYLAPSQPMTAPALESVALLWLEKSVKRQRGRKRCCGVCVGVGLSKTWVNGVKLAQCGNIMVKSPRSMIMGRSSKTGDDTWLQKWK